MLLGHKCLGNGTVFLTSPLYTITLDVKSNDWIEVQTFSSNSRVLINYINSFSGKKRKDWIFFNGRLSHLISSQGGIYWKQNWRQRDRVVACLKAWHNTSREEMQHLVVSMGSALQGVIDWAVCLVMSSVVNLAPCCVSLRLVHLHPFIPSGSSSIQPIPLFSLSFLFPLCFTHSRSSFSADFAQSFLYLLLARLLTRNHWNNLER